MVKKPVFKELVKYYDLLYSWKEYKSESEKIKLLIKKYKRSNGHDLLEVGCGTGKHIQYLKDTFNILATDISSDMLSIARENIPNVIFRQADMIHLNLDKTFDVITCLFSSIGYVKNYKNLEQTIKNFARHLKKGGVVIIEPWFTEASYITGLPTMTSYDGDDIKISRLCVAKKRGIISIMDMHYLIAEKNKNIKHFIEHHELGMFDIEKTISIMNASGLKAKFLKNGLMKGRGLYIGVK